MIKWGCVGIKGEIPRYFVGVGLPERWQGRLDKIKRSYHPKNRLTSPAHITIKRPFWYPHDNTQRLTAQLEKWARKRRPFEVKLEQVGSFDKGDYGVVYLHPDKGRHLKKLDYTLDEEVDFMPENKQFRAHLTLAQEVEKSELMKVKSQIRDLDLKVEFKVGGVVLYRHYPGEAWEKWARFDFKR